MWSALQVPWTPEDTFDEARYRSNVRRCCQAGVHGVYTHGTSGEFYAQDLTEWCAVASATIEECQATNTPVQIGVTDLYTKGVIRRAETAADMGADAVQVALPFWMPLTLDEAVGFFRDVACAVPGIPMVLYGTPRARTLTTIELLRRVLESGVPLIGCKYAGSIEELPRFIQGVPEVSFLVVEPYLATAIAAGARGSCSSYVNVCPKYMLHYYSLCEQGRFEEALGIERHVQDWRREASAHVRARGLLDSALDRLFSRTAGFIEIDLRCRSPYQSATEEDLRIYFNICQERYPEFLYDI